MFHLDVLKKKKLYTIVAVILLTAMYVIIFNFSADTAEESSDISARVAEFMMQVYYRLTAGGSSSGIVCQEILADQISPLEAVIRKLAHFTEYFCIGFWSYSIALVWQYDRLKSRVFVISQLVVSASADEIHQYFVPGRYASAVDVLIDSAGGIAGMIAVFLIYEKIVNGIKKVKRESRV